ncbi:hypothetical protein B4113_2448 [Geobacillus sp. B4113_201601]|nr:hypothetical protein B4113_2448 [Geobacillus sp. B4113_201601]
MSNDRRPQRPNASLLVSKAGEKPLSHTNWRHFHSEKKADSLKFL